MTAAACGRPAACSSTTTADPRRRLDASVRGSGENCIGSPGDRRREGNHGTEAGRPAGRPASRGRTTLGTGLVVVVILPFPGDPISTSPLGSAMPRPPRPGTPSRSRCPVTQHEARRARYTRAAAGHHAPSPQHEPLSDAGQDPRHASGPRKRSPGARSLSCAEGLSPSAIDVGRAAQWMRPGRADARVTFLRRPAGRSRR